MAFETGNLVSLRIPHATEGTTKVHGRITRILENGKIEVKTQSHGYFIVDSSELIAR
jgi:hypothetical protein